MPSLYFRGGVMLLRRERQGGEGESLSWYPKKCTTIRKVHVIIVDQLGGTMRPTSHKL